MPYLQIYGNKHNHFYGKQLNIIDKFAEDPNFCKVKLEWPNGCTGRCSSGILSLVAEIKT